ncbi:MAG: transaldolase family protein [Candidatus Roizmanbacteria bacterium]
MSLPKFFLDSCDPAATREMKSTVGKIDGQTTNPTLLVKNPEVQKRIQGGKIKEADLLTIYKEAIQDISSIIPDGAISIEVYANWDTSAKDMLKQAESMYTWIPNAYMKFPTIPEGLKAAYEFTSKGGRVNMTLVFDQDQAAAVYSATRNTRSPAFVSPFLGRWDDRGYQGVDLIKNIVQMYKSFSTTAKSIPHVEVLAASIRNMDHFYASIAYGADIITAPLATFQLWVAEGKKSPDTYTISKNLRPLPYNDLSYTDDFSTYSIDQSEGGLLNQGLTKFVSDWDGVIE